MTNRVLVIGSGEVEEGLCWAVAQSAQVKQVVFAPGTEDMPEIEKIDKSAVLTSNPAILKQFCKDHNISLVIISTMSLLTAGLIDDLTTSGVNCFGPTMKAAQLQDNKKIGKDFMQRLDIPTARWKSFSNPHKACSFITYADFPALVVKAMTSSAGRNFYITRDKDEACRAVQKLTQDCILGASTPLVVEERLEGKEYICLCLTDGVSLAPLPFVHISKHCIPESTSPNIIQLSEKNSKKIQDNILQKSIDAMRQAGWHYKGLFGAKIMMTGKGPIILGYICTFEDLKSQMIVPLLKPDLYEVIQLVMEERLSSHVAMWSLEKYTSNRDLWSPIAKQPDPDVGHAKRNAKLALDEAASGGVTAAAPVVVAKGGNIVAFPGMAYRKDYQSVNRKGKARHKLVCPDETHTMKDSTSDVAQPGPTVMENVHQFLGRKVRSFEINSAQFKDPVFVCSSSSLGDKAKVALSCHLHRSAAQSLASTCINDLLAQGAQTVFFMPQCSCGQLSEDVTEAIKEGLALGCSITGATLLDQECTQPPSLYNKGNYNLSGFALGVVERDRRLPRPDQMRAGDLVIGIRSPGSYSSNNLSLLNDLIENHSLQYTSGLPVGDGVTIWGELIINSMVFSLPVLHALQSGNISSCLAISEGGLVGSILHYLPEHMGIIIDALCWKVPAIFSWLYNEGELSEQELVYNFSLGVGAVLIARKNAAQKILAEIQHVEEAWMIGSIFQHHTDSPRVQVRHLLEALKLNNIQLMKTVILYRAPAKVSKVAVLISTAGPKLKLMMDTIIQLGSCARLSLIISNMSAGEELKKVAGAGIPTRVIDHKMFGCHSEFERTMCRVLDEFSIDLICLAGFGRIFTGQFPIKWKGKILKLYPLLFPSMKRDKLPEAKVRGYTVCFMLDGGSPGPIILQETVVEEPEIPTCDQMEEAEQRAVAKALHLVATGSVALGSDGCISWKSGDCT
ncbi:trifunctional purine biosynthetic protein adenosine-3-like [Hyla sarda]|uniref:trifunctional purine biosynthetic protein adenosine-3-like n=1 Tax=Hyla sarda TaxID=327740 RepID=UPI0024C3286F|nr:trifunctional purine biosynthetic protein adenosine-3-like [Hyla sarda]